MTVLPTYMCVHYVHSQCLRRPEEDVEPPGTEVTDIVSCHIGVGNRNWVFRKDIEYS